MSIRIRDTLITFHSVDTLICQKMVPERHSEVPGTFLVESSESTNNLLDYWFRLSQFLEPSWRNLVIQPTISWTMNSDCLCSRNFPGGIEWFNQQLVGLWFQVVPVPGTFLGESVIQPTISWTRISDCLSSRCQFQPTHGSVHLAAGPERLHFSSRTLCRINHERYNRHRHRKPPLFPSNRG